MLWMSMVLATTAILAFWVTLFIAPSSYPQRELVTKIGTSLSLPVAILTTILGEGPERKWIAFRA